jgi:hypothetical protein
MKTLATVTNPNIATASPTDSASAVPSSLRFEGDMNHLFAANYLPDVVHFNF